ncbi:MAG: DUF1272 domain-containing protein [Gammaproteobacteria bacterium]
MLKMKSSCEKCRTSTKENKVTFICSYVHMFICSYECTFCESCTTEMNFICPNCSGDLVRRPTRIKNPLEVAKFQIKSKFFDES